MKRISIGLMFCAAAVIASPAQTFDTMVNFNGANGSSPDYGPLIQGVDGNLYGTTSNGGVNQEGTIFQVTPGGSLTTLYSFCSQANCTDGADPYAGLIQTPDGNFYGTTYAGGTGNSCSNGCGTVFQFNTVSGTLTTLYSFCNLANCVDGAGPAGGLVLGTDGNFYGTTYAGGGGNCASGCGSIFGITPQGALTTLQTFSHTQGSQLFSGLILGTDGNFYGTTQGGGTYGHGTVFSFNAVTDTFSTLYNFCAQTNCSDGAQPYAGLIQAIDGNFYGTTYYGGNSNSVCSFTCGTVYEMSPPAQQGGAWMETVLYSFCAQTNCADGDHPSGGLIQAADGNFYGTTSSGGANGDGAVFKMIAGQNSLYVLHSFDITDGGSPYAGLTQAGNGNLYGTTSAGGTNSDGTLFGLFQTNVTTWHNDNLRTGQNINEIVLTADSLSTNNFGELCSVGLDGQVFAQPLVLANVTFNGTQYSSLVYAVTQNNTLYVINGTPPAAGNPCSIITSVSLTPAGQHPADCRFLGSQNCTTINPLVGALGTPVIQTGPNSIGTLYVVTETQDVASGLPTNWYHYLHAVNLDKVAELIPPVQVFPPGPVWHAAQISYWSHHHIQRPALLLVGNSIYIAFSMMDGNVPLPNGAVFKYNVANLSATPLYFATTTASTSGGGGVWQGGAGLAYGPDESKNNFIYFNTGNGNWDGVSNYGDSFIKLDPTSLTVPSQSFFTPSDQYYRNCQAPKYTDLDFGSGGVMLTPQTSNWPYIAVSGDKEGGLWAIDRLSPGGFDLGQCSPNSCAQACSPGNQNNGNIQTLWLGNGDGTGPPIHNTPAYWNNFIYLAPQTVAPLLGYVTQYQICDDYGSGLPFCGDAVYGTGSGGGKITTNYGATLAVSADPDSTAGVVWLTSGSVQALGTRVGGLYALNATTMAELYVNTGAGSPCQQVDTIAPVTKFSVPTVANGFVYVGTQELQNGVNNGTGMLYIFGPNRQCSGGIKTSPKSLANASAKRTAQSRR